MQIIAHRGANTDAPENSLAAFRLAVAQGADGIECDLRLSADGVIILSHDDVLTRSRGIAIKTNETTAADLAAHDVPTLATMLAAIRGHVSIINLELKEAVPSDLLAAAIGPERDGIILSCFDTRIVAQMRAPLPQLPFWYLSRTGTAETVRDAVRLGCVAMYTQHEAATPHYCTLAASAGLPVYVWTLNDPDRARLLASQGVAGITTDTPARIKAAVTAMHNESPQQDI